MPQEKIPGSRPAKPRASRKSAPQETKAAMNFSSFVDPEKRAALIAEAAYFRAEKRGFAPGNEAQDWLAAEQEVDAALMQAKSPPRV